MALLCAIVSLLLGPTAVAEEGDVFNAHYQKAMSEYKAESYEEALREFQAAYAIRQLPRLLLNIGQVHRKLGHARDALGFYELYLRVEPNPKPEIKVELETYIKQTRALLAAAEHLRTTQTPEERADQATPSPKAPAVAPATPVVAPATVPPVKRTRPAVRASKWALLGVGLGAVAAGAVLWSLHGHPTCSMEAGQTRCPQQLNTWVAGASLVAGGGLSLGTSALLFGLDAHWQRQEARPASVALAAVRF